MNIDSGNSVPDNGVPAGTKMIGVGDDSYLTDIDVANTLGTYGVQDSTQAAIKLGSNGPTLTGNSGGIAISTSISASKYCIGTNNV